jgi:hypothetical protein
MWDNRTSKRNPKQPDYKCKDKSCSGAIWLDGKKPNGGTAPQRQANGNGGLDERQRAIIRQHSQSMALELLKLKQSLNELTIVDLSPAKLRALADYFDNDVLKTPLPHRPVEIDEPSSEDEF